MRCVFHGAKTFYQGKVKEPCNDTPANPCHCVVVLLRSLGQISWQLFLPGRPGIRSRLSVGGVLRLMLGLHRLVQRLSRLAEMTLCRPRGRLVDSLDIVNVFDISFNILTSCGKIVGAKLLPCQRSLKVFAQTRLKTGPKKSGEKLPSCITFHASSVKPNYSATFWLHCECQ